jgi:DNA-binding NtrC family response regulator
MNTVAIQPKVLIGIPNVASADALGWQLLAAGCRVDRAHTVGECVSMLEKDQFELIVLDVSLNGTENSDALMLCRTNSHLLRKSPFVFISSNRQLSTDDVNAVMSAGAREILEMPVSSAMVEQLVRMAMERNNDALARAAHPESDADRSAFDKSAKVDNDFERSDASNPTLFVDSLHERPLLELEKTLVGVSPSMAAIRQLILEVAPTRASVMIYGESGTGKELVAQAIHRYSKQADGPFVPVNMAAIPHGLAESLLFGHEKGAFTSAVHNQKGWCEAADGGTLFLDEVGDMEIQVQPKLLRFLQEGTLQRVGSQVSQRVVVRVITATNRDPGEVVSDGRMREDLFFRLHVVPIYVPPLRDRPEDIPALANLFLHRAAERHDRVVEGFSCDALRVLQQHDWPGNVRQLENTVERLVIFARGQTVEADHIPADDHLVSAYAERRRILAGRAAARVDGDGFDPIVSLTPIERHERAAIVDALRRVDGHVVDAAKLLGLGQATVYRKIKQYAIPHERRRRMRRPR